MTSDPATVRRAAYGLMILVTVSAVVARIASAELVFDPSVYRAEGETVGREWPKSRPKPMPTYSSNDRSRWCAVRALVDNGTFAIGKRVDDPSSPTGYRDEGIPFEDGWGTIDRVMKPDTQEFYSSKPPLLATLAAGEYAALKQVFGWTMTGDTNFVVRTILVTFNALPLLVYLVLMARLIERFGRTDWGRLFAVACACFGTFLPTFAVTLNNHTPAAITVLVALYPFLGEEKPSAGWYAVSGLCAGLAFAFELPALAFVALLGLVALVRSPGRSVLLFLPMAALPVAAEAWLNYLAIGEWFPAYSKLDTEWYKYPGSHWLKPPAPVKPGIDWAAQHESARSYAFHVLIGHHGLFSLTPIWILSVIGMIYGLFRKMVLPPPGQEKPVANLPTFVPAAALLLTVVVVGFYVGVAPAKNYGGWTSGLRWLFWLTPLWLLTLLPVADRLAPYRSGRWLAGAFLAVSAFSASYPAFNPWRHPWLFRLLDSYGLIPY